MSQTHFYLRWLKVKKKFYGLTPLETLIDSNHSDESGISPLYTYFHFLPYEKEVLAHARSYQRKNQDERQADYLNAVRAVHDHSLENTTYKASIHVLSLLMVGILMLCASAVSTYKIMDFFGDAFGAYTPLLQGFFFVTATYTQWLIYGITAPDTMKKLFYGNPFRKTWHFNQLRELEISQDGKLVNKITKQPTYSSLKFGFFVFCSIVLAFSLGMILLNTADTPAAEGNVFIEMGVLNEAVNALGGLHLFSRFLFMVYFFCNFALFVSGSMNYLLKEAYEQQHTDSPKKPSGFLGVTWTKTLTTLVLVNLIGLVATILSQTMSTFNFLSGFDGAPGHLDVSEDSDPADWVKYGALPAVTLIAVLGRVIFNIKAMENLENLIKEAWHHRLSIWEGIKSDIKNNAWSYGIAMTGVALSTAMFALMGGFGANTGIEAIHANHEVSSLAPLALVIAASFTVWALYKTAIRYQRVSRETDETPSHQQDTSGFLLKPEARPLSGQALVAIVGNSMGAGGIAQSSTCVFDVYAPGQEEVKAGTAYPLMFGGGVMSSGSACRNTIAVTTRKT